MIRGIPFKLRRLAAGAGLALPGLLLATAAVAGDARLQSIKQHALALYTVSLADKSRFWSTAMILVGGATKDADWQAIDLHIDGKPAASYRYSDGEIGLFADGAMHQLGIVPLTAGPHQLRIVATVRVAGESRTLNYAGDPGLAQWPLALRIRLGTAASGALQLEVTAGVDGDDLQRAAHLEIESERPGKALIILRNLARIDPASARGPRFSLLLARSLGGWGMEAAAEQVFADLASAEATPRPIASAAALKAADRALLRGDADAAQALLEARPWSLRQRLSARMLETRLAMARGELDAARKLLPRNAPPLWRYNLAARFAQAGREEIAAELLEDLALAAAEDEAGTWVRDLASIQLGYRALDAGDASSASSAFGRVSAAGPHADRARLGRGWAALAQLGGPAALPPSDLRPRFARRIDAALAAATKLSGEQGKALRAAVGAWRELRLADPLDPAVQEGLVALPFALAWLGEYELAVRLGEAAVARLEAVREILVAARQRARSGSQLDVAALADAAWPPRPGSWHELVPTELWWREEELKAPANAHWPRLLADPRALRILEAMSMLGEADSLAAAAAADPELRARAQALRDRIAGERRARQAAMNRLAGDFLRDEIARCTRYLVLARLVLAQSHDRLHRQSVEGGP